MVEDGIVERYTDKRFLEEFTDHKKIVRQTRVLVFAFVHGAYTRQSVISGFKALSKPMCSCQTRTEIRDTEIQRFPVHCATPGPEIDGANGYILQFGSYAAPHLV
ncbi:hypothetical protein PoB_002340100 [Plakobranchus ocellatus]|uniref:Uncharacterized protein n=1 Tax=Plakobranchus ocellatus TaxID=259542 RepID=A0AAV3ZQV1_9GAST|nr:hypothetical protein PoB_002340100 [Plakobranchus ocellatus]